MLFRELHNWDFESLCALIISVYEDTPNSMFFDKEPEKDELRKLFEAKIKAIKGKTAVDIVAVDKKITGECEIVKRGESEGAIGIIINLEYRNSGIGKMLLDKGIEKAEKIGINIFWAEVNKSNAPAIKFFLGNGFEKTGENGTRLMMRREETVA